MKLLKFSDNVATIGGKRVPYSLLGAAAAIVGALLIWMQFRHSGGISLGGQSPDLAGLVGASAADSGGVGGGGGGVGIDTSGLPTFAGTPGYYQPNVPVYGIGAPAPVYGPVYAAAMPTPAMGLTFSDVFPTPLNSGPLYPTNTAPITNTVAPKLSTTQRTGQGYQPASPTSQFVSAVSGIPILSKVLPPAPTSSGPAPTQYTGGSAFGKNPG